MGGHFNDHHPPRGGGFFLGGGDFFGEFPKRYPQTLEDLRISTKNPHGFGRCISFQNICYFCYLFKILGVKTIKSPPCFFATECDFCFYLLVHPLGGEMNPWFQLKNPTRTSIGVVTVDRCKWSCGNGVTLDTELDGTLRKIGGFFSVVS